MDAGTPKQMPASAAKKEGEEDPVVSALGLNTKHHNTKNSPQEEEEVGYDVVPNPDADGVDLSDLRGTRAPGVAERNGMQFDWFVLCCSSLPSLC